MTAGWLQAGLGAALVLSAWLVPRHVAAARAARPAALLLDAAPAGLGAGLMLAFSARPVFSGLLVFALAAGLAFADRVKREVLREPVVFSDMSELPQIFTHPQLYLPFAGPGLVIGGAAAAGVGLLALWRLEPALWAPGGMPALLLLLLVLGGGWALSRQPALGAAAGVLRRLEPSGEPFADAARLGPYAALLVHGIVARAERAGRRARYLPPARVGPRPSALELPLVLVQCESFFDARRLSPLLPKDLLGGFDALCAEGLCGRLDVPGWGANTTRAEFAALTGIAEEALGYDRFNPYHAFARAPVNSLAWRLRGAGYRTICLHPFDRAFFRRDRALPALGFDTFLGRDSIGGSRAPPYFPDPDLARRVLESLDEAGARSFIFAITMGNHGPWRKAGGPAGIAGLPQGGELLRYLEGLRRSDEMLAILRDGLDRRRFCGVLGFYGDHVPSLPQAFRHFGFDARASDYVLWRRDALVPRRRDLRVQELPRLILEMLEASEFPAMALGA
ncbi:MAG TPA: LTA synthase family protein [Stellaceae bacterium]|nr:LTA synthase family protein [Stellaceae bacterium]